MKLRLIHMPSKYFLILILTLLFSINNYAQKEETRHDTLKYKKFLPKYIKLQYAGGIGIITVGAGYTFFKNRLDVSLFYGYIPKLSFDNELHSISLQVTGKLLKYNLTEDIQILPLNIGWYAHHTFGSEFWLTLPDRYSSGYYWWSPGRNAGIFIGGEIKTKFLANKTPASGTSFYVRMGSHGLYLASKWGNSSIPFTDILELGFGIAIYR